MPVLSENFCLLRSIALALALTHGFDPVFAQGAVPMELKGRWMVNNMANNWTLTIDQLDAAGKFTGKATFWGPICSAQGVSISGSWTGGMMKFRSPNTRQCGDWDIALKEGGAHLLEGEASGTPAQENPTLWLDR